MPAFLPDPNGLTDQSPTPPGHCAADGDALVHERRDRDAPTLTFVTDARTVGDMDVGEEDLVELGLTGDLEQRAHVDAWCLHVDEECRQTLVLGCIGIRTGDDEPERRDVRQGRPHLLTVEDPLVAVSLGPGGQAGNVGPRPGLAEELAPDLLVGEEGSQVARLLLWCPMRDDGGRAHAVTDGVLDPGLRGAACVQPLHGALLVLRREPEPTAIGREMHPGQTPVELLLEEPLGLGRGGREVGQEAVYQVVDVRGHARTL